MKATRKDIDMYENKTTVEVREMANRYLDCRWRAESIMDQIEGLRDELSILFGIDAEMDLDFGAIKDRLDRMWLNVVSVMTEIDNDEVRIGYALSNKVSEEKEHGRR